MFHKLKSVSPLPDWRLLVHFCDGTAREYDCTPLLADPVFTPLRDIPGLFSQVCADPGGYGISWNDEIDLACDELYHNGTPVQTPFDGLLSFGDATAIWGLSESTLRKAVAYRKLIEGVDVQKYGKQWIVTRAAMLREYGNPPQ